MRALREIRAHGGPYDLGRQHGAAAADLIQAVLAARHEPIGRRTGEDLDAVARRSLRFLPLVQERFPAQVEEIRGLADGAGIPFAAAFFLQVASELQYNQEQQPDPGEGCSALAATGPEGTVIGQNWDVLPDMAGKQIILHLIPVDGPEIMMFTFAGVIGYMGMNSYGLAHVANQLISPDWQAGVPQYFLKRRFLELRTVAECVQLLETMPLSSSANYVLADASGVYDVEMAPSGFRLLAGSECQVHANHFTHPDLLHLERYLPDLPDSAIRHRRLQALSPVAGTVERFKEVLSDHHNYPASVCRHCAGEGVLVTGASVIMDLRAQRMHVAPGNPCQVPYQTFAMG